MRTFRAHLNEKLRDKEFQEFFELERRRLRIAYDIRNARIRKGLSQRRLAELAGVTQQMISRIETADAPNVSLRTVLRVAHALGLDVGLVPRPLPTQKRSRRSAIKRA